MICPDMLYPNVDYWTAVCWALGALVVGAILGYIFAWLEFDRTPRRLPPPRSTRPSRTPDRVPR